MNPEAEQLDQRGTFLSVVFSVMGASIFLFFLFLTCGGLVVYILAVVAGMGVFGMLHYLLWGQAFSTQVASEVREEAHDEEAVPAADGGSDPPETNGWTPEERSWYRRF